MIAKALKSNPEKVQKAGGSCHLKFLLLGMRLNIIFYEQTAPSYFEYGWVMDLPTPPQIKLSDSYPQSVIIEEDNRP